MGTKVRGLREDLFSTVSLARGRRGFMNGLTVQLFLSPGHLAALRSSFSVLQLSVYPTAFTPLLRT